MSEFEIIDYSGRMENEHNCEEIEGLIRGFFDDPLGLSAENQIIMNAHTASCQECGELYLDLLNDQGGLRGNDRKLRF